MQAVVILIALIAIGAAIAIATSLRQRGDDTVVRPKGDCATCDPSLNAKCEQICQMEAAVKPVEYFDDEELDRYQGRQSDGYTDEEAEEFADVMLTMRPDEVAAWNRSLTLRHIGVPNQIKDDMIAIIQDSKTVNSSN